MAYHPCMFVLNFFSKQICNVEVLICHFYKNIKTLTQIHFPRDAHIFRTCTIFYRHYKGLHQMRKDLVLCSLYATSVATSLSHAVIYSLHNLNRRNHRQFQAYISVRPREARRENRKNYIFHEQRFHSSKVDL